MITPLKFGGKAKSIPVGMSISAIVSLSVTLLSSFVIAYFLNNERMSWEQAGYWIMGMLFSAAFLGGKSANVAIKHQKILISLMSGVLYWGLLLCLTALFFGGDYCGLGETAVLILAGSGSAALLSMSARNNRTPKTKYRYR